MKPHRQASVAAGWALGMMAALKSRLVADVDLR